MTACVNYERQLLGTDRYIFEGGGGLGNFFVHVFFSCQLNMLDYFSLSHSTARFFSHKHICPFNSLLRWYTTYLSMHLFMLHY